MPVRAIATTRPMFGQCPAVSALTCHRGCGCLKGGGKRGKGRLLWLQRLEGAVDSVKAGCGAGRLT